MNNDLKPQPLAEAESQRRELYRQQMASKLSAQSIFSLERLAAARQFSKIPKPGEMPEAVRFKEFSPETAAAHLKGARAKAGVQIGMAGAAGGAAVASPLAGGIDQAGKSVTTKLLQQSWLNLINSFGLTYFYIVFHFICRYIGQSKSFCRFGEEWLGGKGIGTDLTGKTSTAGGAGSGSASAMPKAPAMGSGQGSGQGVEAPTASTEAIGQTIDMTQNLAEFLEFIAFGLASTIVLFLIFAIALIIYVIINALYCC